MTKPNQGLYLGGGESLRTRLAKQDAASAPKHQLNQPVHPFLQDYLLQSAINLGAGWLPYHFQDTVFGDTALKAVSYHVMAL